MLESSISGRRAEGAGDPGRARDGARDGASDGDLDRREAKWRALLSLWSVRRSRIGLVHAVIVVGSLIAILSTPSVSVWTLVGLVAVLVVHLGFRQVRRRLSLGVERAEAMIRLNKDRRARRERDWSQLPGQSAVEADAFRSHAFAEDAGIVGRRSLLTLLDTTTTALAHERLTAWLTMSQSDPDATRDRQALVAELEPRGHFRTRLRLAARHAGQWKSVDDGIQRLDPPGRLYPLLALHLICWALVAVSWSVSGSFFSLMFLLPAGAVNMAATRDRDIGGTAHELHTRLDDAARVFAVLERYQAGVGAPRLAALLAPFGDAPNGGRNGGGNEPPSVLARRARRVFGWATVELTIGSRLIANMLVPFSPILLLFMARITARMADRFPPCIDAWARIDACSALAAMPDLGRREDVFAFARFVDVAPMVDGIPHMLVATDVGHPFLPEKVVNPVAIPADGGPAFVTGSNMTGKSTYLRSIAINLALANAGARTEARDFTVRPFRLVTSIAPSDDLVAGVSRFYAEVVRVAWIVDTMRRPGPGTLFLIDEIFSGTNGPERRTGIRRMVHLLTRPGSGGLITTHDIETVEKISAERSCWNRHFASRVDGDRLEFDHRIRDGISQDTNALFILDRHGITDPGVEPKENTESGRSAGT